MQASLYVVVVETGVSGHLAVIANDLLISLSPLFLVELISVIDMWCILGWGAILEN